MFPKHLVIFPRVRVKVLGENTELSEHTCKGVGTLEVVPSVVVEGLHSFIMVFHRSETDTCIYLFITFSFGSM